MGRPPIDKKTTKNTVRIHIVAPIALRKRITAALNKAERETDSAFIRKSIESELTRRERKTKEKGK